MSAGDGQSPTSRRWDEAWGPDSAVSVTDPWAHESYRFGGGTGAAPQAARSYEDSPGAGRFAGYPGDGNYPGYPGEGNYPGYPGGGNYPGDPSNGGYPGYPPAPGYPAPPASAHPAAAAGTHPADVHWTGGYPTGTYPAGGHPTEAYPPGAYPPGAGFPPPPGGSFPGGHAPGWPYAPQRGPGRPKRWFLVVAILAAVALIAAAGALWVGPATSRTGGSTSSGSTAISGPTSSGTVPAGSSDAKIAAAVSPGLVDINTTLAYRGAQAAGTGMVLTSTGHVLTNNHVIEGATSITATDVGNGQTYKATVVGYDVSQDIAVLELSGAANLQTVTIGDSSTVRVGQRVVGIGNAGGTGGTPSYAGGSVTALDQSITASDESGGTSEQLTGLIATDAHIVAGESGGPLVNDTGQVIGMDTAASSSFQFQRGSGGGFAIPINKAVSVAQQAEAGTASDTLHIGPTAFLGVTVNDGDWNNGAQIASAVPNGPADEAGLSAGDTITSVDGHAITSGADLTRLMLTERPGASVVIEYVDTSGTQQSATVQLASGPAQ